MSRVFTNGPGDWGSIPDRVIPKTQKMVLDATLLNTQHSKVRIKGKGEYCPVDRGSRIHRLLLCRWVRPPYSTSVLDLTLNNLMFRFQ